MLLHGGLTVLRLSMKGVFGVTKDVCALCGTFIFSKYFFFFFCSVLFSFFFVSRVRYLYLHQTHDLPSVFVGILNKSVPG